MEKRKHHESTIERVRVVRAITEQHYESGNQARCYKAVWRQHIFPKFKICYRTYLNYLGIPTPPPVQQPQQLTLWVALNESPDRGPFLTLSAASGQSPSLSRLSALP